MLQLPECQVRSRALRRSFSDQKLLPCQVGHLRHQVAKELLELQQSVLLATRILINQKPTSGTRLEQQDQEAEHLAPLELASPRMDLLSAPSGRPRSRRKNTAAPSHANLMHHASSQQANRTR